MSTMQEVGRERGQNLAMIRWQRLAKNLYHIGGLQPDDIEAEYLGFAALVGAGIAERPDGFSTACGRDQFGMGMEDGYQSVYRLISDYMDVKDWLAAKGVQVHLSPDTISFSEYSASQQRSA